VTVFFVSPATSQEPIGGVRKIYDQVDILNSAGIAASVIQGQRGYRPTWWPNQTRITYAPVEVRGSDILVWPEYLSHQVRRVGVRQVIFAQNAYGLFADSDPDLGALTFGRPAVLAVAVVSEDSAAYLRYGWPDLETVILPTGIDPAVFHPGPKRRQITYSSRRRYRAVQQVLGLLRTHGALDGWELAEIVRMDHAQVAEKMRSSALFLSFSEREGLGLPPLEALASGCHVIGFAGMGGSEYFDARYTQRIPEDDIVAYARAVETWLRNYDEAAETARGVEGSAWALERYSLQKERTAVIEFYSRMLATPTVAGSTVVRPDETWGIHDRPRSALHLGLGQIRAGLRTMRGR
jgi:glycosyltransferase involved in cell wall biosynthesis